MTRKEIMQHLESGKKIAHETFKPNEYLRLKGSEVLDEKGKCYTDSFFSLAKWEDGWALFTEKSTSQKAMPRDIQEKAKRAKR